MIGFIHGCQGDFTSAFRNLDKALDIISSKSDDEMSKSETSNIYFYMGGTCHMAGDMKRAEQYFGKAISLRKSICGENHFQIAVTYNDIAALCLKTADSRKGLDWMLKAIDIIEPEKNRPRHHSIFLINAYILAGNTYLALQESDTADKYVQKAVGLGDRVFRNGMPRDPLLCLKLGLLNVFAENQEKARLYFRKGLDSVEKPDRSGIPETIETCLLIRHAYSFMGDDEKSVEYLRKAGGILERTTFINNAQIWNSLASLWEDEDCLNEALECVEKAVAILMREKGPNNPATISSMQKRDELCRRKAQNDTN